nr:hypothetical protein [Actinokineospora spheciospongiae]
MILMARSRLETITADLVPLKACWINGSFVTDKERPSDIDMLVIIDGERIPTMREIHGLDHEEATRRTNHHEAQRYEVGGTALDHLTSFSYTWWFPEGHGFHQDSLNDLEHWSRQWSRVRVMVNVGHDSEGNYVYCDDGKGFVEVRW